MAPLHRTKTAFLLWLLLLTGILALPVTTVYGQNHIPDSPAVTLNSTFPSLTDTAALIPVDSMMVQPDSVQVQSDSIVKKKEILTEIVEYESRDSLVFLAGGTGKLYGEGKVSYDGKRLEAGYIQMNMDSSQMYAVGIRDSSGAMVEDPVFSDKSGTYNSKSINYNFKTGKGIIKHVITQQGEGYVVSGLTKKTNDNTLCMIDGKYTTCDHFDHPHFYLDLSKAKVKPGEYMVSGPAHLVMEDVDLPLFIPFGYFPISHEYQSGILSPSYGDELSRGFYLKDMGYYFAINDYIDMALTGELYSKGSWGVKLRSSYKVKYKYSGAFTGSYIETVTSEKNLPDYQKVKNLSLSWRHSQDAKADQFRTLSASVNFATSGYSRNDVQSYYNASTFSSNTKSSSINLSQRFSESPFSLNLSANITQQSKDSLVSVSFPSLSVSMSTLSPFKRKNMVGNERWYEKIRVGYSASFSNSINNVKEYDFFKKSLIKDWKNGVLHSIPISATFNVLNAINITPSMSYTERWTSSRLNMNYEENTDEVVTDTIWGFNRIWDYSLSLSASTKLYGMYQPIKPISKLLGDKLKQIRHVMTPSISYTYRPDFGDEKYGYYGSYSYYDEDGVYQTVSYSKYANSMFSMPGKGKYGSVGFSLANNLEMKLRQVTDTTDTDKKVSLIDNLSFSSSYNLAADSLNLSNISVSIRLKFGSKYTLNLSSSLDPYTYQLNAAGQAVRVNETTWHKYHIPGRFTGTSTSFSYSISNETFKKKDKKEGEQQEEDQAALPPSGAKSGGSEPTKEEALPSNPAPLDPEAALYEPFNTPWSISLSYSLRYGQSGFNKTKLYYDYDFTQNLSLSGNINLFNTWKFTASTSFNFDTKQFATMYCSVARDLHCWQMSASFIPLGAYKSYNFSVRVKSSMLADLKYEQQTNSRDNYIWGY